METKETSWLKYLKTQQATSTRHFVVRSSIAFVMCEAAFLFLYQIPDASPRFQAKQSIILYIMAVMPFFIIGYYWYDYRKFLKTSSK